MSPRAKSAAQTVILEVSPRVAKLIVAAGVPPQIQRVDAAMVPEHTEEPLSALRSLLSSQALGVHQAGILFGRETFSLRTLELPSSDPKEISSMLELQLGKLTPYPRAEIIAAWRILGSFREGYTSVLLAIGRKTGIEDVLRFLKTKGVMPQWVGVSTEGLESWWTVASARIPPLPTGQVLALIDIDASSTDCTILSNGRLLFSHSLTIGAEQLASSEPAKLRWVGELVRLPRVLQHEDIKGQIGRGIVTGLTDALHPLIEQLAAQWGVSVEVMDALASCSLSSSVRQRVTGTRVSYTALAGIVLSGKPPRIDLLPEEARVSQALHTRATHLTRLAGNLAAILVLAAILYLERIVILRSQLTTLHQRLATMEQTSREVMEHKHVMQQVHDWLDASHSSLEALHAVASAAGNGITVTQFTFADDAPLKVRGTAESVQAPYEFVDRLKQQKSSITNLGCYVANARSTGSRGAEFEVLCGKSAS